MKHPTPSAIPEVKESDIAELLRGRVRRAIEEVLEEELSIVLGAEKSARSEDRRGYRHGASEREVTTECGPKRLRIPRGRVVDDEGKTSEWRSELLPAYQRRTRQVDETILGVYLAGANSRRIRKALEPLLGTSHLSKSAISRVVTRLRTLFEAWRSRDLSQEMYKVLFLDAIFLPVRMARRVVRVPVQIALGVREDGQKVVVGMQIAVSESTANWDEMIRSLGDRRLVDPLLIVMDGCPGLRAAIRKIWPSALVQRCTQHKRENLKGKVPRHAHDELNRDYRDITHALSGELALRAYHTFLSKWSKLCPAAATSLEEAGLELITFYRFPRSMWRALRSTNTLERLNEEFRRRVKTQGAMPNEGAAMVLLYGLLAFGQITLRRIDGWKAIPLMKDALAEKVA